MDIASADEKYATVDNDVEIFEHAETNSAPRKKPSSLASQLTFERSSGSNKKSRRHAKPCSTLKQQAAGKNDDNSSPKRSQQLYETIHTHFVNNGELFFVVCNDEAGGTERERKQRSLAKYYAIKPVWYMAGSPALRDYYRQMDDENDRAMVPVDATLGDNAYAARPMRKLLANMYRCCIEINSDDPKPLDERREYTVHIPKDWSQLAYYRMLHYKIDRVVACAVTRAAAAAADAGAEDDSQPPPRSNAYLVRWQNEPMWCNELLPIELLHKCTQHRYHHQMVLDFWEESCVQDLREFDSAASVNYLRQETALKTNENDPYWIKRVHRFQSAVKQQQQQQNLIVYKCIEWPLTTARVHDRKIPGTDLVSPETEMEAEDLDPKGFDEYVQLVLHDKFVLRNGKLTDPPIAVEELTEPKLRKYCNTVPYMAHVPHDWRQLGEQHAAGNARVQVLGVFRQAAVANVYLVQWPSYDHPTLVASLTLRKRHARDMVAFFEQKVYWPQMQLFELESQKKSKK